MEILLEIAIAIILSIMAITWIDSTPEDDKITKNTISRKK